ncbi:hypothetical protein HNP46_005145 [Pseudomonas nitritireducens]|uniref:Uncharacterized protein n=1 Tax=Pseudomonas nitroreducens TaxID=46680 RepID=A0A7W7P445_PSENT|nr:hypothetical protein [Pseudomonas nitritireducens]MBB4866240.1 hypothetical protein [Pseudomonas nitritireducens]
MQVILDSLLLVGSLVELLLYFALSVIVLASVVLLSVIAVLTLRSPAQPLVIADPRPAASRKPRPAVKHQLVRPLLGSAANEAVLVRSA